jgi:hypothetical protein
MKINKARFLFVSTLTLFLSATLPAELYASVSNACATDSEKAAFDVRTLQTELMIAALSCSNDREQYNNFVTRYQGQLKEYSKDMQHYFTRNYPRQSEQQLNRFITKLANNTSQNSRHDSLASFCDQMQPVFDHALTASSIKLSTLALDRHPEEQHGIKSCHKQHA